MLRLAAVGLGTRASNLLKLMKEIDPSVELAALVDPQPAAVKQRLDDLGVIVKNVRVIATPEELAAKPGHLDGVIVGTRCHLHAEMAVRIAPAGLPLLLEKPVAISREQLDSLSAAYHGREDSVVVSFPLRFTPLFLAARQIVESGRLGTINQVQAINNVSCGGVYFGSWFRDFAQTGGLWLQKATHDVDYMAILAGSRPVSVCAMVSRRVFGGDKPEGLTCLKCGEKEACVEGPRAAASRGDDGGAAKAAGLSDSADHWCVFGRDIHHQDAGSAIIMYDNGVHGSYTQNFVTRLSAGRRGAIVTGHAGTLEFDWPGEKIRVVDHHRQRVDHVEVRSNTDHAGGDHALAENFIQLMKGKEKSCATLHDGVLSAATCLAIRESANTHTFQPIEVPVAGHRDVPPRRGPRAVEAAPAGDR